MIKILLVEDSPENQLLIQRRLVLRGFEVITADDGQQGVDMALAQNPAIILMDLDLPILNGWDATKQLREKKFRVPIIALTAHAMDEHRDHAFEVGCTDFLTKPIDFELLTLTIQKLCS